MWNATQAEDRSTYRNRSTEPENIFIRVKTEAPLLNSICDNTDISHNAVRGGGRRNLCTEKKTGHVRDSLRTKQNSYKYGISKRKRHINTEHPFAIQKRTVQKHTYIVLVRVPPHSQHLWEPCVYRCSLTSQLLHGAIN